MCRGIQSAESEDPKASRSLSAHTWRLFRHVIRAWHVPGVSHAQWGAAACLNTCPSCKICIMCLEKFQAQRGRWWPAAQEGVGLLLPGPKHEHAHGEGGRGADAEDRRPGRGGQGQAGRGPRVSPWSRPGASAGPRLFRSTSACRACKLHVVHARLACLLNQSQPHECSCQTYIGECNTSKCAAGRPMPIWSRGMPGARSSCASSEQPCGSSLQGTSSCRLQGCACHIAQ